MEFSKLEDAIESTYKAFLKKPTIERLQTNNRLTFELGYNYGKREALENIKMMRKPHK